MARESAAHLSFDVSLTEFRIFAKTDGWVVDSGFVEEGRRRELVWSQGEFRDGVMSKLNCFARPAKPELMILSQSVCSLPIGVLVKRRRKLRRNSSPVVSTEVLRLIFQRSLRREVDEHGSVSSRLEVYRLYQLSIAAKRALRRIEADGRGDFRDSPKRLSQMSGFTKRG